MSTQKKIVVYTSPGCGVCSQVKNFLNGKDLEFEVRDIASDGKAQEELMAMGLAAVPVTVVGDGPPILGAKFNEIEEALSG